MAKVRFRLNNPSPDKLCSILAELYVSRAIRPVFATGEHCKPEYWDGARVVPARTGNPSKGEAANINRHLAQIESDLMEVWRDSKGAEGAKLKELAKAVIAPKYESSSPSPTDAEDPTQKKTSLFTVGRFLAQCRRELDPATVRRYAVLWRALSRFQRGKRLDFSAFDMSFHDRFKNFLYDTPNPNYTGCHLEYDRVDGVYVIAPGAVPGQPIGLFDEVVFKYLVQLKTVCDWAVERGYKVHPSYKEWEIIKREYEPITWTLPELEAIESLPPMGKMVKLIPHKDRKPSKVEIDLDYCRDYISFASRTGPRVSDVKRFDPAQIKQDVWTFTQRKGNRTKINTVQVYLTGYCSQAKLILEKYDYRLPKISETNLNIGIKEVCRRAGITQEMFIERWAGSKKIRITGQKWEFCSSHTCKKSCITIMAGQGIPVPLISQLTGTSEKTIYSNYLGKIDSDKAREYLNKAGENKTNMRIAN